MDELKMKSLNAPIEMLCDTFNITGANNLTYGSQSNYDRFRSGNTQPTTGMQSTLQYGNQTVYQQFREGNVQPTLSYAPAQRAKTDVDARQKSVDIKSQDTSGSKKTSDLPIEKSENIQENKILGLPKKTAIIVGAALVLTIIGVVIYKNRK